MGAKLQRGTLLLDTGLMKTRLDFSHGGQMETGHHKLRGSPLILLL